MRTLLVDDRADSATVIANWLHQFFGTVSIEWAPSGDEALAAIGRSCPDLVLAAHRPPAVNAVRLVGVIKGQQNAPAVVVIVTNGDAELETQCAAAGADFHVEKRHLQTRLLAFLQRRFSLAWTEGVTARRLSARPATT